MLYYSNEQIINGNPTLYAGKRCGQFPAENCPPLNKYSTRLTFCLSSSKFPSSSVRATTSYRSQTFGTAQTLQNFTFYSVYEWSMNSAIGEFYVTTMLWQSWHSTLSTAEYNFGLHEVCCEITFSSPLQKCRNDERVQILQLISKKLSSSSAARFIAALNICLPWDLMRYKRPIPGPRSSLQWKPYERQSWTPISLL